MTIRQADNLACPLDGMRLERRENQLACEHGHTFDIARQGYVNLLPVQYKRTKEPGDSKAMVAARARFLGSGIYEPVAEKLTGLVYAHIADRQSPCLLDAGCGEGYYLDYVFNAPEIEHVDELSLVGMDISKAAVVEAAKRNRRISWVVGTNRQPPLVAETVDLVICVFGFQSFEGFVRILKPGGRIILVEPGPDHLQELRALIYRKVKRNRPPDLTHLESMGLTVQHQHSLRYRTGPVDNASINQLLLMTPHFFRAGKEGREAAAELQELDLSVDMFFRVLQKD